MSSEGIVRYGSTFFNIHAPPPRKRSSGHIRHFAGEWKAIVS